MPTILDQVTERMKSHEIAESANADKPTPPGHSLKDFVRASGERLLDGPMVKAFLGDHASSLISGDRPHDHPLAEQQRKVGAIWQRGVTAAKLASVIEKKGVPFKLSSLAIALIECTIKDYADACPSEEITPSAANSVLGIPKRDFVAQFGHHAVAVPVVADWAARNRIDLELGVAALRKIVSTRRLRAIEAEQRKREAERPRTLVERAADARKELERMQAEEARVERERSLKVYRGILSRRDSPAPDDAVQLAYLQIDLGFDDEQVQRHIGQLDKIRELQETAAKRDSLQKVANEKEAEFSAIREAARKLNAAEKAFGIARDQLGYAIAAPREIELIKESNRDLFGSNE